jgi:hypothetical protein
MSIAAGTGRIGRTSRGGSTRPGVIGRLAGAGRRVAGALGRGRGAMMGRRRRGRGISRVELRGFRKIVRLLRSVGMRPKGTGHGHVKR